MNTNTFIDGKLMMVHVRFWGARVETESKDFGIEKVASAFKLGHKMLIPEEVIGKFRSIENKARRTVEENSFPFPIGNANFVPLKKFTKVLETLKACSTEYDTLTQDLVDNYEVYKAQMIPVYREAAEDAYLRQSPSTEVFSIEGKEADRETFVQAYIDRIKAFCPSVEKIKERFSMSWDIFEIALPELHQGDGNKIALDQMEFEEAQKQMREKVSGWVNDVVGALRSETLELCKRITTNITEGKVIKGRTLNSLRSFIEKFNDMNFVGDKTIEAQLTALKKDFLDVHTPEEILKVDLQNELKRRLGELAEVAGSMTDISTITGEYRRKIAWE